jgi:hypothetical protein
MYRPYPATVLLALALLWIGIDPAVAAAQMRTS